MGSHYSKDRDADLAGHGGMLAFLECQDAGPLQLGSGAGGGSAVFNAQVGSKPLEARPVAILGSMICGSVDHGPFHRGKDILGGLDTITLVEPSVNGLSDICSGHYLSPRQYELGGVCQQFGPL